MIVDKALEILEGFINTAELSMNLANNDGAEFDTSTEVNKAKKALSQLKADHIKCGEYIIRLSRIFEPAISSRIPSVNEVENKAHELMAKVPQLSS